MVRTVHSSISVEERQQAAEALHESIAVQVEALTESGEWERFLAFAGAFHAYSLSNVLLILSQCPTATRVAGFRKWQTLGRQVRRGEKSIRIFGYRTIETDDDTTPSTGAGEGQDGARERGRVRAVYPMLSVFDIARPTSSTPTLATPPPSRSTSRVRTWPGSRLPSPTTSPPQAGPSPGRRCRAARTGTRPPTAPAES